MQKYHSGVLLALALSATGAPMLAMAQGMAADPMQTDRGMSSGRADMPADRNASDRTHPTAPNDSIRTDSAMSDMPSDRMGSDRMHAAATNTAMTHHRTHCRMVTRHHRRVRMCS